MPTDTRARRPLHAPSGDAAPPSRRATVGRWTPLLLAALLAGCAPRSEPTTFAVPTAAAARIRLTCPPGTFIGTMTANCPQPASRAAPAR